MHTLAHIETTDRRIKNSEDIIHCRVLPEKHTTNESERYCVETKKNFRYSYSHCRVDHCTDGLLEQRHKQRRKQRRDQHQTWTV